MIDTSRIVGASIGTIDMLPFRLLCITTAAALASPCFAAAIIPDELQQEAMTCVGEAMQVCPDVWTAEDHGIACMTGKRQSFSPRCRVIYDKVAQVLHVRPHGRAELSRP